MPVLALKLQTIIFVLTLQLLPLFSVPLGFHQPQRPPHFFQDFIDFSDFFPDGNAYLHDLLAVMKDFSEDLAGDIKGRQREYNEKAQKSEETIASLENKSATLDYEIKYLTRHIYMLEDEIESNGRQIAKLLAAKQQIIGMKRNESEVYHAKLREREAFSADYSELMAALGQSLQGFRELMLREPGKEQKETLAERRMTLGKIKAKKKTIRSPGLMNFLLLNEPFLGVAVNSDLSDRDSVGRIARKLEEMISGLEESRLTPENDVSSLNESYRKRVETLYKEYENVVEELKMFEGSKRRAEGFRVFPQS